MSHERYPDRETPKYFSIPETETRRFCFLAAAVFSETETILILHILNVHQIFTSESVYFQGFVIKFSLWAPFDTNLIGTPILLSMNSM